MGASGNGVRGGDSRNSKVDLWIGATDDVNKFRVIVGESSSNTAENSLRDSLFGPLPSGGSVRGTGVDQAWRWTRFSRQWVLGEMQKHFQIPSFVHRGSMPLRPGADEKRGEPVTPHDITAAPRCDAGGGRMAEGGGQGVVAEGDVVELRNIS